MGESELVRARGTVGIHFQKNSFRVFHSMHWFSQLVFGTRNVEARLGISTDPSEF